MKPAFVKAHYESDVFLPRAALAEGGQEMIATHIAAAAAAAVVALGGMQLRIDAIQGKHKAALDTLKTGAAEQRTRESVFALNSYATMEITKNAAIEAATARATKSQADAAGLRRQLDSVRSDLADVPARIAAASRAAVDEYAAAATVVFQQCSERYAAMAQVADRHANDAATCRAAWPVNPSRPGARTN